MASLENLAQKRHIILAAAEKVFSHRGYAATTMDAVAAEGGISKGNIYNHFKSKEELFKAVFAEAVSGGEAGALAIMAQNPPAGQKLDRLLDFWFERLSYTRRIGRLVLEFWATAARQEQGELAKAFADMYSRFRGVLVQVLSEGVCCREFAAGLNAPVAASLILAMLDGIQVQSVLDYGAKFDADYLAALKRAIMAALSAASPQPQVQQADQPRQSA